MNKSTIPTNPTSARLTFAMRCEYVAWATQHNGVRGFKAGVLQAICGSFGALLLWKLFSNPMTLSFPTADFFVKHSPSIC